MNSDLMVRPVTYEQIGYSVADFAKAVFGAEPSLRSGTHA
jgi:hypothetical protein